MKRRGPVRGHIISHRNELRCRLYATLRAAGHALARDARLRAACVRSVLVQSATGLGARARLRLRGGRLGALLAPHRAAASTYRGRVGSPPRKVTAWNAQCWCCTPSGNVAYASSSGNGRRPPREIERQRSARRRERRKTPSAARAPIVQARLRLHNSPPHMKHPAGAST